MYGHVRYVKIRRYIGQVVLLRFRTLDTFTQTVLVQDVTKDGTLYYKPDASDPNIRYIDTNMILRITTLPELNQVMWKLENT